MGVKTLQITLNDLQPYYYFQVKDSNGVVDLTGSTLVVTLKNYMTGSLKINRSTSRITVTDATNGLGEIRWVSGDTDTKGLYKIEIEITPTSGGKKFTIPPKGEIAFIEIVESQDTQ